MKHYQIKSIVIQRTILFVFFLILFAMVYYSFSKPKIIMSYFAPEEDKSFASSVLKIDAQVNHLNVLAYAFLHVSADGNIIFNHKANQSALPESFRFFLEIQNRHHHLKKLFSIGGADDQKSFFYAINNVDNFVNSARVLINEHHLAGIDLDFEINRPYTPEEARGYATLVDKLRKKLGSSRLISMATIIDTGTLLSMGRENWRVIANNADFISIMCYDLTSPFSQPAFTELASNLYLVPQAPQSSQNRHLSCDQSIHYLATLDVPTKKIVLGIPAYAISYGGVGFENNGLFQPSVPDKTPIFDDMGKGLLRYSTVITLSQKGFRKHQLLSNGSVNGVWLYNPETCQLITFDNAQSVQSKMAYVLKNKLAGVMMWRIGQDVPIEHSASLLHAVVDGMQQSSFEAGYLLNNSAR